MTLLTVQIILAVLGLVTGLLIALFGPGSRWIRWPLALAAGAGVAITAWPGLWVVESSPDYQLYQSLMLASVVVLMALLAIFLIKPRRRKSLSTDTYTALADKDVSTASGDVPTLRVEPESPSAVMKEFDTLSEPGRDAININLEQSPDTMIVNQKEHALMHMLTPGKKSNPDTPNEIIGFDTPTERIDAPEDNLLLVPADNELAAPSSDNIAANALVESATEDTVTENVVSLAERRERRVDETAADSLALSDSDELYEAMREAEAELDVPDVELDLPDESSWLKDNTDPIGELDDKEHQMPHDLHNENSLIGSLDTRSESLDIEDAEIIDIDDDDLSIGDATITQDAYLESHPNEQLDEQEDVPTRRIDSPAGIARDTQAPIDDEEPKTLQAAQQLQRHSIDQLNTDTDALAARLTEWSELANTQEESAWVSSLQQSQIVDQQNQRIAAENNFRESAVELIHTQREVMRQLMGQITKLGSQRKKDLETLTAIQKNALEQRRLAREAALLARKAAAETQSLNGRLQAEKQSHERAQGAAKRAIVIARDAVDKLAEHERRLGISSGRAKSDR